MRNLDRVNVVILLSIVVAGACSSNGESPRPAPDLVALAGQGGTSGSVGGGMGGVAAGGAEAAGSPSVTAGSAGAAGRAGVGGGAAGSTGGAGGSTPMEAVVCPQGRGPAMVAIELPGYPSYCIDATEVTQYQYSIFVDQKVDPLSQSRSECAKYNHTFFPKMKANSEDKGCEAGAYDPKGKADRPVDCVDFCDAVAYCEWAGKRLCGSVDGGAMGADAAATSDRSQWYLACSQGGKTKFPYGDELSPGKCDVGPFGEIPPVSESKCQGSMPPFDKVKNLSGGAFEWEDACPSEGICRIRGGSSVGLEPELLECGYPGTTTAWDSHSARAGVGFRCCFDGL